MILPDYKIREWAEGGGVYGYNPESVNPASIDLRLGDTISVPRWYWNPFTRLIAWTILRRPDPRKQPNLFWSPKRKFARFTLWPGCFVLCHSFEATQIPPELAAAMFLKSTAGRTGLEHLHAGWGDPGFGNDNPSEWTWELINAAPWPIVLQPGQRLAQLVLMRMEARPSRDYSETGRYQGQRGPTAPREERS